ncbi:DUF6000 family protein [Streptomyces sp. MZ04]|uniref:DUF6000 family protein n=1 Tax=Streptomyces sp. MZ04 TaxID=2559236 RepID=UPI00107E6E84|nr:DUF6000 family protein [Streptomyces sp. MZ04]TGA99097.1 hypothetical protein E2651_29830 [Streptomyces sp. MZ04]
MRHDLEDPELRRLRRHYVAAGQRYLRLRYSIFRLKERERTKFARELARAADAISPHQLGLLLDSGWRERKTAAWLIAIAGRTDFRPRLGELLLASEAGYAGHAYCITLATFGTEADADLLAAYLDRYLPRPDLDYDQSSALGALLHLDATHGTDRVARFLTPNGPWQQWVHGPPAKQESEPAEYQEDMARFCSFAQESARHCTAHRT